MTELRLFLLHRLSAVLLLGLGLVHLVTLAVASQGPLDAAAILARTRSSWLWPPLYTLFVLAAATHASLGLRTIGREWLGWSGARWWVGLWIGLTGLGLRAVWIIA